MTLTGPGAADLASPAHRYLFGLRIGVAAIAGTLLLTMSMLRNAGSFDPVWIQPAAWLVLATVVAVEAALLLRRRRWGSGRWVALAAIMAASLASMLGLPSGAATTAADWSTGVVGWVALIVLFDRPLVVFVAFLGVHEATVLADVLITRAGDVDAVLNAVSGAIGTVGYPLAAAIAATALSRAARTVERSWREGERLRTQEVIADHLHASRRERFAALDRGVLPLLRSLRDGRLDPGDQCVQRACCIEAARLRRMFAESDVVADPLLHVVRQCVDLAERRGIVVDLQVGGSWPDPPGRIRRDLTEGLVVAMSTVATWARVTVLGADGVLTVGVVADCRGFELTPARSGDVVVNTVREGDVWWVQARWGTQ